MNDGTPVGRRVPEMFSRSDIHHPSETKEKKKTPERKKKEEETGCLRCGHRPLLLRFDSSLRRNTHTHAHTPRAATTLSIVQRKRNTSHFCLSSQEEARAAVVDTDKRCQDTLSITRGCRATYSPFVPTPISQPVIVTHARCMRVGRLLSLSFLSFTRAREKYNEGGRRRERKVVSPRGVATFPRMKIPEPPVSAPFASKIWPNVRF